mgnify:FL=1
MQKLRFKADDGSEFPDWEEKTINEIAECLDNTRVPINSEERKKRIGIVPYYGAGGIQGYIDDYLFDEKIVLLLEDGDAFDDFQTKSIAQYVTGKSWINNHAHVLRANGDSYFLFASLEHKDIRKWTQLAGASRKKLLKESMLKITVNMPSLQEQKKISDFLSNIDMIISNYTNTVKAWEERKKGIMWKLFSQEIRFKGDDESDFPEWEEKRLGEFCKTFSGGTPKSGETRYYENGTIPFIRSGEIHDNKTELYITKDGLNESSAKMVAAGDILYALYGATSGEVDISKINGAINQAILCIRTVDGFDSKFIVEILRFNKEKILRTYLQGGQGNLSAQIIQNLCFYFPCFAEQQKIANCFSSLDNVIEKQKTVLTKWEELKKGLLQRMLV